MKHLAITPVQLAVLAAILGGAAATTVWVATYRVLVPPNTGTGPLVAWGLPPTTYASPAWTTPVAAVIAIAAVGVAALVLRRR
jgi:hypothetical protein